MVAHALEQPTRSVLVGTGRPSLPIWPCSRWGLPAMTVTSHAVSSYLTVSPLPVLGEPSHRRSFLCCTFRRDKRLAQVLPGNVPYGARTFLEHLRARDHPADSIRLER